MNPYDRTVIQEFVYRAVFDWNHQEPGKTEITEKVICFVWLFFCSLFRISVSRETVNEEMGTVHS